MKLYPSTKQPQSGHILLMGIIIAGCAGVALIAYLSVIVGQNSFTARSQMWNVCMPVVEAGLEEGLAHINNPGTTNFATMGWTWDATAKVFTKQGVLGNSYYVANIQPNLPNGPTITSTGYVPAPVTVADGGSYFMAAAMPAPGVTYISRTVRVTTRKDPLFGKALVVKNSIDFKGNNVTIDSYNSALGNYGGANIGDKGNVTTDNDIVGNVSTGNGDIWGHLITAPLASVNTGPNSVIGSLLWHAGGNKGIQPGWLKKDANVLMPDVQQPWVPGTQAFPTGAGAFKYILNGGNYEIGGACNVTSSDQMFVKGDSTLWVRGDFTMAGNVKMNGSGYRMTVYVSGNINFSGTWDKSIIPSDLIVYGLPTCKSISVSTGSHIECVLYAPEADMSMIGNAIYYGSAMVNSMRMNGTTGFHYDEALGQHPAYRGYVVTSWTEL